jgi:uncharacterized protein YbjT (DUF2867 family)
MTILVTGARGSIGSRLIATLARAGHPVRGTARDAAAPGLPPALETVALDISDPDPRNAEQALRGVQSVFLHPARGGVDTFLAAAGAAGVRYVVLLSSPASYEPREHDRHIGLVHRAVERSLEASGLPHTVLYPSWLAGNASRDWAAQIRATGTVALAYPDAWFTPIHPGDVAEVAADLLTRDAFRGRMQILTGPRSLRLRDMVGVLGEVLGRSIPVQELTREQALQRRETWMPEPVLEALLDATEAAIGVPAPVNNTVERITGHPPRSFRAWAHDHADAFLPSSSPSAPLASPRPAPPKTRAD